jgi:hypothetical protein
VIAVSADSARTAADFRKPTTYVAISQPKGNEELVLSL